MLDHGFQAIGPALHILHLNVAGLSVFKRNNLIHSIAEVQHTVHITYTDKQLTLQECQELLSAVFGYINNVHCL